MAAPLLPLHLRWTATTPVYEKLLVVVSLTATLWSLPLPPPVPLLLIQSRLPSNRSIGTVMKILDDANNHASTGRAKTGRAKNISRILILFKNHRDSSPLLQFSS
ncbi:universal stress protein UspE, partial [Sesbania bispinosa]